MKIKTESGPDNSGTDRTRASNPCNTFKARDQSCTFVTVQIPASSSANVSKRFDGLYRFKRKGVKPGIVPEDIFEAESRSINLNRYTWTENKNNGPTFGTEFTFAVFALRNDCLLDDLEWFLDAGVDDQVLIFCGKPHKRLECDFADIRRARDLFGEHAPDIDVLVSPKRYRRSASFFDVKYKSHLMVLDRDGHFLEFDAHGSDLSRHEIAESAIDELEIEQLIGVRKIVVLSQSGHVFAENKFAAHVYLKTATRLARAEQDMLVKSYNIDWCKQNGCESFEKTPFDTSVYRSAQSLFIRNPRLHVDAVVEGRVVPKIELQDVKHPPRIFELEPGGDATVAVTQVDLSNAAAIVKAHSKQENAKKFGSGVHEFATPLPHLNGSGVADIGKPSGRRYDGWIATITAENKHDPITNAIMSIVSNYPPLEHQRALDHMVSLATARLTEVIADPASLPASTHKHLSEAAVQRSYEGALKWREANRGIREVDPVDQPKRPTVAERREALDDLFVHLEDSIVNERERRTLVLTDATGVGKSERIEKMLAGSIAGKMRSAVFVPRNDLRDQAHVAVERFVNERHEDDADEIRVEKLEGRDHICANEMGEKQRAALLRSIQPGKVGSGIVCGSCPKNDVCPWFNQDQDPSNGITIGVTHLLTSSEHRKDNDELSDLRHDIVVVDEALDSIVLGADSSPHLDVERFSVIRIGLGFVTKQADLNTPISQLQDLFRNALGLIYMSDVGFLFEPDPADKQRRQLVDTTIEQLEAHFEHLGRAIKKAGLNSSSMLNDVDEKLTNDEKTERFERQIGSIGQHVSWRNVTSWMLKVLTTIKINHDLGRQYEVFNLSVEELPVRNAGERSPALVKHIACIEQARFPEYLRTSHKILSDATGKKPILDTIFKNNGINIDTVEWHGKQIHIPHWAYTLRQDVTMPYGKKNFIAATGKSKTAMVRKLMLALEADAAKYRMLDRAHGCFGRLQENGEPGKFKIDVLCVTQKKVKELMIEIWAKRAGVPLTYIDENGDKQFKTIDMLKEDSAIPTNIALENFGALAGLNCYANVDCAFFVGRPMPSHTDLERDAAALALNDPDIRSIARAEVDADGNAEYQSKPRAFPMKNGTSFERDVECCVDPFVDALKEMRVDGAVVQAIGRLRLCNRDRQLPACSLVVLGQTDTGLEIDEMIDFEQLTVSPADVFANLAIVPSSAASMKLALKSALANDEKEAIKAAKLEIRKFEIVYRQNGRWVAVSYRRAGQTRNGKRLRKETAYVDLNRIMPDAAKLQLERLLGCELTMFQFEANVVAAIENSDGKGAAGVQMDVALSDIDATDEILVAETH